jgi:hypothetical protein
MHYRLLCLLRDAHIAPVPPPLCYNVVITWSHATLIPPCLFCVTLRQWCDYLVDDREPRPVPKDVWNMLLDFAKEVKPDLSNYDPYVALTSPLTSAFG